MPDAVVERNIADLETLAERLHEAVTVAFGVGTLFRMTAESRARFLGAIVKERDCLNNIIARMTEEEESKRAA